MRWTFKKLELESRWRWRNNRIVKKFLFKPRRFNGYWRWLETAYIREEVERVKYECYDWVEQGYSTKEEYVKHFNIATGEASFDYYNYAVSDEMPAAGACNEI